MTAQAIIVSHGQPSDPDPAEAKLAGFASDVASLLPGWHVGSATLAKPGALDLALEKAGRHPLIYPMFMTAGWFTGDELIKRLDDRQARVLPPLGLDPGLPGMAADLLRDVLRRKAWTAQETRLFIAAHGSGRSRNSARDTQKFAKALAGLLPLAEMRVGFVEEPPYLADMAFNLGPRAISLPFFAARGGHVVDDIPEALDLAEFQGVCLEPIGAASGVSTLVARALEVARVNA
ncbi:CbiX/SirB N-terminal domain-containing protein [Roseovarius sp.]|uniref:CbiX/SirB N-terminal domain-containing protein n=1 Tax=Roseovarius sp. TaxID=1486281 RepID=UPI00260486E1|nr:CbiX/SirB N-terminal domain-containing protein [Roseovarius sp.]